MQISKAVISVLKYLSCLAILMTIALGLFAGKNLYSSLFDVQSKSASAESNNLLPSFILGETDPCESLIYTSLPPKCRTFDGKFIAMPEFSPYISAIPKGK